MHSRLHGPRCRAIVENVFVLRHAGRTTEHAGGWAMLRPFERPDALRDLQSERRGAGGRSAPAREDLQMEQLQQVRLRAGLRVRVRVRVLGGSP